MVRFSLLTFLLVTTVLWAPDSWAKLVRVDSFALRAQAADVVLVGRVLSVETVQTPDGAGDDERATSRVSLASERVFKGQEAKVYRYVGFTDKRPRVGQRVLAFLSKAERFPDRFPAHFKGQLTPSPMNTLNALDGAVIDLERLPSLGLPTREFHLVANEKGVLAAVEKGAATTPLYPGLVFIPAPEKSDVCMTLSTTCEVFVGVPLDRITLRNAVRDLKGKRAWTRKEAVRILGHMKSKANIRRIKRMLSDRGILTRTNSAGTMHFYPVRRMAYWVLTQWGVKVRKPAFKKK